MAIFLECAILSGGIIAASFLNLCCFLEAYGAATAVAGVLPAGGQLPLLLCPPTGGTCLSFTSHSLMILTTGLPATSLTSALPRPACYTHIHSPHSKRANPSLNSP